MPSTEQVLGELSLLARHWKWLAICWHAYVLGAGAALLLGWKPARRTLGMLITLPLLSAALLAWVVANPFNGILLGLYALLGLALAARLPTAAMHSSAAGATAIGGALVLFGLVYPHFLPAASLLEYAYSAPLGVVPCPSLAVSVGFSIVASSFGSRLWAWLLGAVALFYGAFGALRLGVAMDAVLAAGAILLILLYGHRPADPVT